jgi:hypothetical protein
MRAVLSEEDSGSAVFSGQGKGARRRKTFSADILIAALPESL